MLARLTALSDDHFNVAPDEVTWGDVGSLAHYADRSPARLTPRP